MTGRLTLGGFRDGVLCDWRPQQRSDPRYLEPIMKPEKAISFVTRNKRNGVMGYNWRIWSTGTSFYIAPRYTPISNMKISLHGPDEREEIEGPVNFLYVDPRTTDRAEKAGGMSGAQQEERTVFSGRKIAPGVNHVVRFRTDWDTFVRGRPSGPVPDESKSSSLNGVADAPRFLRALNVDVFVSDGKPYWPDEELARAKNAGLGPVTNKAGQSLTVNISDAYLMEDPDPFGYRALTDDELADSVRMVLAGPDETGLCWVCEKIAPRQRVKDGTIFPSVVVGDGADQSEPESEAEAAS
ncbi:hypothetical protein M2284_003448 [Rhodococcus sp. LBL1]|nr:hypothetical protein [Rhodococcus sp. LBL1]MDH6685028.1 hypothetical protein [Rhodococcus sp. LBL2]